MLPAVALAGVCAAAGDVAGALIARACGGASARRGAGFFETVCCVACAAATPDVVRRLALYARGAEAQVTDGADC